MLGQRSAGSSCGCKQRAQTLRHCWAGCSGPTLQPMGVPSGAALALSWFALLAAEQAGKGSQEHPLLTLPLGSRLHADTRRCETLCLMALETCWFRQRLMLSVRQVITL